jgi:hypothetical protein
MAMVTTTDRNTGEAIKLYYHSLHRKCVILAAERIAGPGKKAWKAYAHDVPGESHQREVIEAYHKADGSQLLERHARPFFDGTELADLPYYNR